MPTDMQSKKNPLKEYWKSKYGDKYNDSYKRAQSAGEPQKDNSVNKSYAKVETKVSLAHAQAQAKSNAKPNTFNRTNTFKAKKVECLEEIEGEHQSEEEESSSSSEEESEKEEEEPCKKINRVATFSTRTINERGTENVEKSSQVGLQEIKKGKLQEKDELIRQVATNGKLFKNIDMGRGTVRALIDSGADISLVSRKMIPDGLLDNDKMLKRIKIQPAVGPTSTAWIVSVEAKLVNNKENNY